MSDPNGAVPADPGPGQLWVTSRTHGDAVIVTAVGEIDLATAPELDVAIRAALAVPGPGPVVLDLTAVTFLASSGLGVLVDARNAATARREPLRVVVDHNRPVLNPIHIIGIDAVLALYDTVTDALHDQPRSPDA